MSEPRVSVIVPTYNRGDFVLQAVRSALAQTFDDLEVIVADDGSDDGTAELLDGVGDPRLEVLRLEHSGIPAAVRNVALSHSRGDLVALLDDDDVWLPEKLERQVAVIDREPAVGLVCSNARVIDGNGAEIGQRYLRPEQGTSGDVLEQLLDVNFVIASSAIVRRELIERVGGFSEDFRLHAVDDYDLWLRVAAISRVAYLPEPLLSYREHDRSIHRGVPHTAYWTCVLAAVENLEGFLGGGDERGRSLVGPARARILVQLARVQHGTGASADAARSLADAVRIDVTTTIVELLRPFVGRTLGSSKAAIHRAFRKGEVRRTLS